MKVRKGATVTTEIRIGGGDDWMDLIVLDRDHAAVGPNVGNVSTCRTCGKGAVLVPGRRGWDDAVWQHVGRPPKGERP